MLMFVIFLLPLLLLINMLLTPHLQLLKVIYVFWRRVYIVWAPLWANVPWTTHGWNPCFTRNTLLIYMHTKHGIHTLIILIHMIPCMLMGTLVHIVNVRVTLQSFAMIEYIIQILQTSLFGLRKMLTPWTQEGMGTKIHSYCIWCRYDSHMTWEVLVPWWWMHLSMMDTTFDASPSRMFGRRTTIAWKPRE